MVDLVDYITHNRPELVNHPRFQELAEALEVDVLGYADDCLRDFRAGDRLADAMADERWTTWTGLPLDELPAIGTRVVDDTWRVGTLDRLEDNHGRLEAHVYFGPRSYNVYSNPLTKLRRWVPLPLDAATLGTQPAGHRAA